MNFVKQTAHAQELEELPVYRKRKIIILYFRNHFKKKLIQ